MRTAAVARIAFLGQELSVKVMHILNHIKQIRNQIKHILNQIKQN